MKGAYFDILDESEAAFPLEEFESALDAVLGELAREEDVSFAVAISLTDEPEIQRLNREFRGTDAVTDVLSFPSCDLDGTLGEYLASGGDIDVNDDGAADIGDIAICVARAGEQAKELGHSLVRECAFLALHGALHCMGYDHMEPDDEEVMTQKQRRIIAVLDAPEGPNGST